MYNSSPTKSPQAKAKTDAQTFKNRKEKLLELKKDTEKEDLQLLDKQKMQVVIGTKICDKFSRHVASGTF